MPRGTANIDDMRHNFTAGDWVEARAFGGEVILRRVVATEGGTVYVCRDEEFESAVRESREAVAVGFQPHDLSPASRSFVRA